MSYVDENYYNNEYLGTPVDDGEFDRLAKRASEEIDSLTGYKIKELESLHPRVQEQVKKAVCAHIESFQTQGGYEASQQELNNVSIGSFSYSAGDSATSGKVPAGVINHLKYTGLLYAGVRTW